MYICKFVVLRLAQKTATIAHVMILVLENQLGAESRALHELCNSRGYGPDAVPYVGCGMERTKEIGESGGGDVYQLTNIARAGYAYRVPLNLSNQPSNPTS